MNESIIERIQRLIDERGMKDVEFCELAGVPQSTFSNWKKRNSNPSTNYIPGIAKALDTSEKYILTGEELDIVDQIMIQVNERPELEELFLAVRDLSQREIEQIVKMIETFKK